MVHREYYILFKTRHVCLEESQYEALVPVMQQCIETVFGTADSVRAILRLAPDAALPAMAVATEVSHVRELVAQIIVTIEGQDMAINRPRLTEQAKAAAAEIAKDKFIITNVTCKPR